MFGENYFFILSIFCIIFILTVKRPAKIGELEAKMLTDLRIMEICEMTLSQPHCSDCIRQ